ncbi:DUF4392 domain-containing protein [candidate division KSB1 bacterium]|nr:DUF4392 domain-containing protein [candidate division KSB1 bacterium]
MKDRNTRIKLLEKIIQLDIGYRGIHSMENENLCTCTSGHLQAAANAIAGLPRGSQIGILTGCYIPHGDPPAPESDGPPGALCLARGLQHLGYDVLLITDEVCENVLQKGMRLFSGSFRNLKSFIFPMHSTNCQYDPETADKFFQNYDRISCLISVERIGPCHDFESILIQKIGECDCVADLFSKYGPGELAGKCLNMRAESIDPYNAPTHLLFDYIHQNRLPVATIGIGDGGNEIGMGAIPWNLVRQNINSGVGGRIACRVLTDYTIVAGVSNWGAQALLASIACLMKQEKVFLDLITEESETACLQFLTENRLAVDGVLGIPNLSVDGIGWDVHLSILKLIRGVIGSAS